MGVSSNTDDRSLHELYLWPFADAIHAGTAGIMCSYNRLNQPYACENPRVLDEILRKELGFEGYVVSDWFAVHSGRESLEAGLDINMPGAIDEAAIRGTGNSYWGPKNITRMVESGVDPIMTFTMATQRGINLNTLAILKDISSRDVRRDHAWLIRKIGADGIVLLKNLNNTLPLKAPKNVGIFGNDASPPINGIAFEETKPFVIGTLDVGGCSSTGRKMYLVSTWEAIMAEGKQICARVQYIFNNEVLAADDFRSIYPTPEGKVNSSGKLPSTILAEEKDYEIPIINLSASEVTSPGAWQANFTEGQFIEYSHFDKHGIKPLFQFGFGLSCTGFEIQDTVEGDSKRLKNVAARPDPNAGTIG
ncbi:(trans)glycosidase [Fusarium pseudocircinatum]|uniref:Probable beta-glucosidase G n=1 Tax=Fusarium pseudocircinatum TaxID=56676 RepID=A0A8H5KP53_9HYPO|nr:(trans)glycosidase [Fusarium pseudocircinatum]